MKTVLTGLCVCFLLASCDGFVVISGGPPYPVIFDQETFDAERAAWLTQNIQTYVFTLTHYSPKPEPTRIVVEAGTVSAYTALGTRHVSTITNIYSDLAKEIQQKRADYEAGKIVGARIAINYSSDGRHYPYSIESYIDSSEETVLAGGYYQKYIRGFSGVSKPDPDATPPPPPTNTR